MDYLIIRWENHCDVPFRFFLLSLMSTLLFFTLEAPPSSCNSVDFATHQLLNVPFIKCVLSFFGRSFWQKPWSPPCVALTSFPGQDSCCLSAHISPIPSNQNAIRPLQAVWNANSTLPWQRGWVNINRMPDSSSALTPWLWTKGADASKGLLCWHFLSYVLNVAAAPPDLTHSVALEALEFVSLFSHPMRTWDIALT